MVDNVYKSRRIKWGDPGQKLRMLPTDRRQRGGHFPLIIVLVFLVVFVGTMELFALLLALHWRKVLAVIAIFVAVDWFRSMFA